MLELPNQGQELPLGLLMPCLDLRSPLSIAGACWLVGTFALKWHLAECPRTPGWTWDPLFFVLLLALRVLRNMIFLSQILPTGPCFSHDETFIQAVQHLYASTL